MLPPETMLRYLAVGLVLGLVSGLAPGPFSAVVAATGLERGFRAALLVAVVPLLSETVVLILASLLISQIPRVMLQWMGVAGGALLLYLGWRVWKAAAAPPDPDLPKGPQRRRVLEGVSLALLSPAPWVFWLLVGAPLFLGAYRANALTGVGFLGAFLAGLVGVHVAVAAVAGLGHEKLPPAWYRRLARGTSVALVAAAGLLAWQSWVGNFERMVAGSRDVQEELVGDSLANDGDAGAID